MFFSAAPPTPAIIYGKLIQSSLPTSSARYTSHLPVGKCNIFLLPQPFFFCVFVCVFVFVLWFHPILPTASLLEGWTLEFHSAGCFVF